MNTSMNVHLASHNGRLKIKPRLLGGTTLLIEIRMEAVTDEDSPTNAHELTVFLRPEQLRATQAELRAAAEEVGAVLAELKGASP